MAKKTPEEIVDALEGDDLKHVAHLAMEKLQKHGGATTQDDSGNHVPTPPPPPSPPKPGN